ncbi:MAG TPA: protein kinase, partial [Thermoanaerobaculia bacterium]|nr:protein kinase [Thermoanaerobaculia bacterium]
MADEPTVRNRPYVPSRTITALQRIGPYHLIRSIGEGGMGTVFLAHQQVPVSRDVAIKVIRSAFSRAEDRMRFQAEQQAMARLQHPNVAQMFEAGTTEEGYPYFVMEWLDGESITDYCDRRALSIEQRLELFLPVCDGVQHAHQKSLVHRDLKPSNILVVDIDGRPVPKIIDFGVAKALDDPLGSTAPTGDGIVGTPAYLSPEAVTGATRGDLDTRADVYALGLVLYKLLAGTQPYESDEPLLDRMLSIARVDTMPPRQHYASMKESDRAQIAAARATTPVALERVLRGDLEPIVLKALAKDPADRFQYASELADELQRFLITSDSIFSRKDLMQYMKSTFAEEVERERARMAEYADIKAPEGMLTEAGVGVPVLARTTGPILAAVPTPPSTPSVVRSAPLPKLTAAAPQQQPREDEGTLVVDNNEVLASVEAMPPIEQPIVAAEAQTDPERARLAPPESEPGDDAPVSPVDETIVRLRPGVPTPVPNERPVAPPPLPPRPAAQAPAAEEPPPSPPAP